jgi:hypothetical protein
MPRHTALFPTRPYLQLVVSAAIFDEAVDTDTASDFENMRCHSPSSSSSCTGRMCVSLAAAAVPLQLALGVVDPWGTGGKRYDVIDVLERRRCHRAVGLGKPR